VQNSYIVISPVKDEEKYVTFTIDSMLNQTRKPVKWVIVNDGSRDRTKDIIEKLCQKHDWVQHITLGENSKRQPGAAVIRAFNEGCKIVCNVKHEYVVKLDCDLRFDANYFECILERLDEDEDVGIASGLYLEKKGSKWIPVRMPAYHAAGACKIMRKRCFDEIGGFILEKGWDTVDEIRAHVKGWKTLHYPDLVFYHLKNEGTGIGYVRTNMMHGEIHYTTGGSLLFFMMKTIHRMIFGHPIIVAGFMMFMGYVRASITNKKMIVNEEEARNYKALLNRRITEKIKGMFA
jgi:poly-beta-1,6-N-acetyl-D-glucosamine synthase